MYKSPFDFMNEPKYKQEFAKEFNRIMEHVPSAIDWLVEHCNDGRFECINRAMNIIASGCRRRFDDIC